ncbi:hypothetical protein ACHQM5_011719 [Ranunculus cassubicifolius]
MIHSSSSSSTFHLLSIFNKISNPKFPSISDSSHQTTINTNPNSLHTKSSLCSCGRRHFIGASGSAFLLPITQSNASALPPDPKDMLKRVYPPRPDWYEEFFAQAMETSMKTYEKEITDYKVNLFNKMRGRRNVLELGIGTGPNLTYYARDADVYVFGVDPNKSMEKYTKAAVAAAGLASDHFTFLEGVGEALPVGDGSMDAVIGTLVLCSVKDVKLALQEVKRVLKPGGLYIFIEHVAAKDGTTLRFIQNALDPLQQLVSDGCHLTRETGTYISQAGFHDIEMNTTFVSNASLIGPHVYGIASK